MSAQLSRSALRRAALRLATLRRRARYALRVGARLRRPPHDLPTQTRACFPYENLDDLFFLLLRRGWARVRGRGVLEGWDGQRRGDSVSCSE